MAAYKRLLELIRLFRRRQLFVLSILILTLLVTILAWFTKSTFQTSGANSQIELIGKSVAILKEAIYALAILIGGLWSYYIFARGRTFDPRLTIDIENGLPQLKHGSLLIIRFRITNVGNVKIVPVSLNVAISSGHIDKNKIEFAQFAQFDDLLADHYPSSAGFRLEPKDQMIIDIPVQFSASSQEAAPETNCTLIRISALLVDNDDHLWKEQRIIGSNS